MVKVRCALVIRMIGDDQRDLTSEFATLVAIKEVLKAVIVPGDEDGEASAIGRLGQSPIHFELPSDWGKMAAEFRRVKVDFGRVELDTKKKQVRAFVSVLIGGKDVAVMTKDK